MLSHHRFNGLGVGIQLVHIRCRDHDDDIIQKHLLIFRAKIVQKLLGFEQTVL